jgi:adenylate kinase
VTSQGAILLLGPTGSGKTPLGRLLAERGLQGRRCLHFDFGAELRRAASDGAPGLDAKALAVLRAVLACGRLLTDAEFPIAEALLRECVAAHGAGEDAWLILNGLPRHAGQAEAMERLVRVRTVAVLECAPDVVRERIRRNSGGDRMGRADDTPAAVEARLRLFTERTEPLCAFYAARGARVIRIPVQVMTRAQEVAALLDACGAAG